ncbi:hypothetical protein L3X38_017674 [Prunus dulcis]|uniref:Gag/pol protein n=1 Tax=Prunus dulcis TaxID=3755 RepID=A0AAD4W7Q1_PRUDU|nr:hypothetical protein L3X38_017674 [Prunus dulcis]
MKSEMNSMYANQVWTLVDPPEGIVPIGNKWVFKRKKGSDGMLTSVKLWLSKTFSMKDLRNASYIVGNWIISIPVCGQGAQKIPNGTFQEGFSASQTWLDISYAVSITSRYQSNPGSEYWSAVKTVLKYLRRAKDMFLVYGGNPELLVEGYINSYFKSDVDDRKSTTGYVFTLNGGAINWRCCKQSTTADFITEAECIATSEAAREAIWMRN